MEHAEPGAGGSGARLHLATPDDGLADLLESFYETYTDRSTRDKYRSFITGTLLSGRHPSALTVGDVIRACDPPGRRLANNTIRGRLGMASRFLTWCERRQIVSPLLVEESVGRLSPLRRIRRTFGKVQAAHPGRWLTKDEVATLLASCEATDLGLRDRIALRLGILGMRITEVGTLTWGNVHTAYGEQAVTWMGKGRRSYTSILSPSLIADLHDYKRRYELGLGRGVEGSDPIYCGGSTKKTAADTPRPLVWGRPVAHPRNRLHEMITRRASAAGLGHVAFHDLRRTAAGLLHREVTPDGAHLFDLLDIQKILHHADPAVTLRYCLEPMDNAVSSRAASALDF